MKPIWELEISSSIVDRLNFVKRVKEIIELKETADIPNLEKGKDNEDTIKTEKRFVKMLKEKLSKYQVNNQKGIYKCLRCRQPLEDCTCGQKPEIDETDEEHSWINQLDL